MGRGRRAGPSSSDDSDDGASPAGGLSSQLGKGSKKQWKPGMSGKEQKARAKEQRLEQERRKAEREKRNEDKREKREQLEHESAEISGATPPRSASRRARQHDDEGPSSRDGGPSHHHHHHHGSPHHHHHHARGFVHDAAQIRREVRRLFGRIQHGGSVVSLDSGLAVACGVGDVFVVVAEDSKAERRKSGAEAWSARVQKGAETETPLKQFLRVRNDVTRVTSTSNDAGGFVSNSSNDVTNKKGGENETAEPPYHRVRRVFLRRRGEDDEPRVVEETLWDAHVSADDAYGARRMASLRLDGFAGGSPDAARSPRFYAYGSPSAARKSGGFRGKAVAASSLLPGHCWEEVFARCDPASVARLGATCAELAELARSSLVQQAQHAKLFGRAAPVGSPLRSPRPPRAGAPPAPPASPATLAAAAARKGWAATCASFVAADPWLPRLPALSAARSPGSRAGSEDEDEDEDADERDGARFSDDGEDGSLSEGVAFDDDDDDFDTFATPSGDRSGDRDPSHLCKERRERSVSSTFFTKKNARDSATPRPRAAFRGVGPQSARHLLANDAAAVSCDGAKIKLWFHGGDGVTESGKRIATLPNPAGAAVTWTALAAGPGTFLAGDAAGRLTVWDADTLEVKHARCNGVAEWDEETQNAVTQANSPLTSLAAIPNSTLVACASRDTSVVRFLDVAPPAEAPQTGAAVHSHARVIGSGPGLYDAREGAEWDDADLGWGVDALAVSGGEVTYGAGAGDRAFAPRGPGSSAPKLWAVARSAPLGDAHLVPVDLGTLAVGGRLKIPDAFFPELERVSTRAYGEPSANADAERALGSRFSVATYGDLVAAAHDGVAAVWDARVASAARETPVMLFRDDAERFGPADAYFSTETRAGGVAVDEWAVWVSRGGGDGVRLYDARRATGPPRGKSRWHDGDALQGSPVAVYGVRGEDKGDEDRFVRVGAFARGGNGALVVAPAALASLSGEVSTSSGVRCSVFTSARHADGGAEDGEDADAESAAWEDGFAKPRAGKKKAAKKVRKKYPKRQGGKFRARTAGG